MSSDLSCSDSRWDVDENGCWLWNGPQARGYGHCTEGQASRVIWREHGRELADDHDLHHLCPNKLCVNPNHLEPSRRGPHQAEHHRSVSRLEVLEIRKLGVLGVKTAEIAQRYGVGRRVVSRILEAQGYFAEFGERVVPEGVCEWCGIPIIERRRQARFCSKEHRVKANNAKRDRRGKS